VDIEVDVKNLWKVAYPFKVYTCETMQGDGDKIGEYYKGFVIKMRVNPQDVGRQFNFVATVFNSNTISVRAPALDWHDAGHDADAEEVFWDALADPREDIHVLREAFTHGRNDFKNRKIDNSMIYYLKFNGGVHLSSDLYIHHERKNSDLTIEAIGIATDLVVPPAAPVPANDAEGNPLYDTQGRRVAFVNKYMVASHIWRVADLSQGTRKQYVGPVERDATDGFNAMFGNMNMGA
jgi:hypothetical protein